MSKKLYKPGFDFLTLYLDNKYGVHTVLKSFEEDAYYGHMRAIYINKNNHWRDRLIALIHESGHVQLDLEDGLVKNMKSNTADFLENIRSKKQFISLLNEEITAWNLGKKLANELNIFFDNRRLDEVSTNCIMSYVKSGLNDVYGKTIDIMSIDPKV
tara:strand:- start:292 stop:762 length:471 start_codon:yes stop_codon:yes gene_type:complete